VKNENSSFTITKRNVPAARMVELENENMKETKSLFGCMRGVATIKGDIVNFPTEAEWDACNNQDDERA
jgi:antitoxin (DNA-binding transcriptional repressor) of toxin-antitoxin stability system